MPRTSAADRVAKGLKGRLIGGALGLMMAGMAPGLAHAEVRLPHLFSDHMALQAGKPLAIWGWASPGEAVTLRIARQRLHTRADAAGRWLLHMAPLAATTSPITLRVNDRTIEDVVVGEVWLASGQSNMDKPLGEMRGEKPTFDYEKTIAQAENPQIRLFHVAHAQADQPREDVEGQWVRCTPASLAASNFSAAGYYFARALQGRLRGAVGVIQSSVGGTRIELWTAPEGFAGEPSLSAFAQAEGKPGARVQGSLVSVLFNGMIAPLAPYGLRGVLWYQGESNVLDVDDRAAYLSKMRALVLGWRQRWKDDLAFDYVQIAPHLYHVLRHDRVASAEAEPLLWEAQTAALSLPNTGMIVTTDLVDDLADIHPRDKKSVGERLANLALARSYGIKDVAWSGPTYRAMAAEAGQLRLHFDHAEGLATHGGKAPDWFTIAGADGHFFPAKASIEGEDILLSSAMVASPTQARFAWDEAAQPNLFNAAGLPARPFRTETGQ